MKNQIKKSNSKITVSYEDMLLLKEIGTHVCEKTSRKILSHIIRSAHTNIQLESLIDETEESSVIFKLDQILYKLDEVLPEI